MSYIYTYTGRKVTPMKLSPFDVDLLDIAHALSNICRFTGHVSQFYSVAEHCVHVSELVPYEHTLWGLLHDAAEAYIGDFNKPTKEHVSAYNQLEEDILANAVAPRFHLEYPMPGTIKEADRQMSNNEMRDLMGGTTQDERWQPNVDVYIGLDHPWRPALAKHMFLVRYVSITGDSSFMGRRTPNGAAVTT
jgi:hypothetical protein